MLGGDNGGNKTVPTEGEESENGVGGYWDAKISIAQGQEGYDVLVGDSPDNRMMVDRQE